MKYFKLYENFSPRIQLQQLGYDIKSHLGDGNDGSVYSLKNGNAIKIFDYNSIDDIIENILNNLKKCEGVNFQYLVDIYDYQHIPEREVLAYTMEQLKPNPILDYSTIDENDNNWIDFVERFISDLNKYDFNLEKSIQSMLIDNKELFERFDVKDMFINYFTCIYYGLQEIEKYNLDLDPRDENVMFDPKQNKFKIIDYV